MRSALLAVLLIAAPAGAKEKKVKPIASDIDALARFQLPKGWEVEKRAGADPSLRATQGRHVLRIRLYGGPGSRYDGPEKFLSGFEAMTMGRPVEKTGEAKVGGLSTPLYRHGYPIALGDPHMVESGPPKLALERFCLVAAGKRFFVLSYAYESAIPDPGGDGEKAWEAFLKGFSLR